MAETPFIAPFTGQFRRPSVVLPHGSRACAEGKSVAGAHQDRDVLDPFSTDCIFVLPDP